MIVETPRRKYNLTPEDIATLARMAKGKWYTPEELGVDADQLEAMAYRSLVLGSLGLYRTYSSIFYEAFRAECVNLGIQCE